MERGLVFAGVVVAMIVAVGAGASYYLSGGQGQEPAVSIGGSVGVESAGGLLFGLRLNSTVVSPGHSVGVTVSEENNLNAQNNVSASQAWGVDGLGLGACGRLNYPFGFEVLSGYYNSTAGLGGAHRVEPYQPGVYNCPAILSEIFSYSFYPRSDRAQVVGGCTPEPCFTDEMNATLSVRGGWGGGSFEALSPGVYTVVAGDEWGALVYGHFVVSAAGGGTAILSAGTTFEVSSSFDCLAGHRAFNFTVAGRSVFSGAFKAGPPGVALYVATAQEAENTTQGHPSGWVFSTGLVNSSRFAMLLGPGAYVAWVEGADLHCGSQVVLPLELLTRVNVTETFMVTGE